MTHSPPTFNPDNAILVVIDTQEQWVPMIPDRDAVVRNIQILLKMATCFDMPVIVAEHVPWMIGGTVPELRSHLPEGTPIIEKTVYNTWLEPRFARAIEGTGRTQLVFSGIETHVCMGLPALEALRRNYDVFVAVDATGAQTQIDRDTAFQRFWQAGAVPVTWNTLIFEGLEEVSLRDGMPANERSRGISELWLEALPHIAHQFHYDPSRDPGAVPLTAADRA